MTRARATIASWALLAAAAVLIAISIVWGRRVQRHRDVKLGAAPLVGRWHVRWGPSLLLALGLAALVVAFGPRLARTLCWRAVVASASGAATAFTLLLAMSDGLGHVLDPVVNPTEYWANLAHLPPAGAMVRRFDTIPFLLDYSVHAKGHPPGFLLLLKALAAVGLGHPWVTGALSYLGVVATVAATLATVHIVAGEARARTVAPFTVVAPFAVWMGTSADAFYAGVLAVAVMLVAIALTSDGCVAPAAAALGGGLAFGALAMFTYGAVIALALPATVAVGITSRRRGKLVAVGALATLGALAVVGAFRAAGFSWLAGLRVTRTYYWLGTARFRPPGYFALANIAVVAIAAGPAVLVGLGYLRDRRLWLLVVGALVCIAVADASQYSKGEVERIWLLFFPWLVPAVAALTHQRRWLAAQAALALALQLTLASKW